MSNCKDERMWAFQGGDNNVLQFQGAFAELRIATISFVMSVCPSVHQSTWNSSAPTGQISWNLIFEYFSKICRAHSRFLKIWQVYWALYMKTKIHFWSYLTHFFIEWEMFETKFVEKNKPTLYVKKEEEIHFAPSTLHNSILCLKHWGRSLHFSFWCPETTVKISCKLMCQTGILGSIPSQQQAMMGNTAGKQNLPAWLTTTRGITPETSSSLFMMFISPRNKMQLHSEQITRLWK